jgi:protein TonB
MMHLWAQTYAHTAAGVPSTVLSVAAHAVLIGAAVYGTGTEPDLQANEEDQRSSTIFYLPPPDRVPRNENIVEHLQYIEVGAGAQGTAPKAEDDAASTLPALEPAASGGGSAGLDLADAEAHAPVGSQDSVFSILTVEESAVRSEGSAAPIYPREMLEQGLEGRVLTRYVIDTTGRADPSTLEVLRATNASFVQSVRDALPGMRFTSAMVQGRKVRQLVEQNFEFHIAPPAMPASAPAEHTRTKPVP